jgi:hypothetical protein
VTQVQVKVKGHSLSASSSKGVLPLEIMQLLDVLARIEARRQEKLRITRKGAS